MDKLINVVGLGYIGLPTALMMAANGSSVIGTDIDKDRVISLNNGALPFDEIGMFELFQEAREAGISFSENCVEADIYIVSVPTPYNKDNKKIDPTFVINAVNDVLKVCKNQSIIAIESTIAPGTIDQFIRPLIKESMDIDLAHVPERIIPGSIIRELKENSRTIGVDNERTGEKLRELYGTFCRGKILLTDICTAEMTKVVENTYRDINIAFANELTKICSEAKLDVYEVIRIANEHPRVNILQPGPGVGGHCISVDPWFLVGDYPGLANIILAARKINDSMPEYVLERVSEIMDENKIKRIDSVGFYGLTYKENVDDIRESPTLQLIECMKKHLAFGARFYDPYVNEDVVNGQIHDLNEFINNVELIVIMVAHEELIFNKDRFKGKIILDTRNVFDKEEAYHL